MMAIRRDDLEAAARILASTPPERIRTHRISDDAAGIRRGGRPCPNLHDERMEFIRANMGMKRRQIAAILGISPDRVSRLLQFVRGRRAIK